MILNAFDTSYSSHWTFNFDVKSNYFIKEKCTSVCVHAFLYCKLNEKKTFVWVYFQHFWYFVLSIFRIYSIIKYILENHVQLIFYAFDWHMKCLMNLRISLIFMILPDDYIAVTKIVNESRKTYTVQFKRLF